MRYPESVLRRESPCGDASDRRLGGSWLWTLLHAHALVDGSIGIYDAALIEDDRRRLAGRQAR